MESDAIETLGAASTAARSSKMELGSQGVGNCYFKGYCVKKWKTSMLPIDKEMERVH